MNHQDTNTWEIPTKNPLQTQHKKLPNTALFSCNVTLKTPTCFHGRYPVDNFGTVGENPDCLLLSGTVVGENPDHVCWV